MLVLYSQSSTQDCHEDYAYVVAADIATSI